MIQVFYLLLGSFTMVRWEKFEHTLHEWYLISLVLLPCIYIYSGYHPHLYFWDVFTFLRNIALSVIIVFLDSSTTDGCYQQGLAALLVFLCSTGIHAIFHPYVNQEVNHLETVGLVVSMMTLYLGLWTFSITSQFSVIFASILIFIINGIWCLCIMGVLFSSFRNKLNKLSDHVIAKWPTLASCLRKDTGSSSRHASASFDVALEMGAITITRGAALPIDQDAVVSKVNPLHVQGSSKGMCQETKHCFYICINNEVRLFHRRF